MTHLARHGAHEKFLQFVSDFYRDAGSELPYFDSDADSPIAFEARVDNVNFSVGYDPQGTVPGLFVYCVLGTLSPHEEAEVLGGCSSATSPWRASTMRSIASMAARARWCAICAGR